MKALRYLPGIRDQLQLLPPVARVNVKAALEGLVHARKGLDVKRLQGEFAKPLERLKVGAWRIAFYQDGDAFYVVRVFSRRDGYDWLTQWEL